MPQRERDELMNAILRRSVSDPAFRHALLSEPRTAIREAFGINVPDDFRVQFIEKGPGVDALVVLPDLPSSAELSDEDLETVAGGVPQTYLWAPPRQYPRGIDGE